MGYRSNVVIVIYGEKDDVTAFVASERLKGTPKGMQYHPFKEPCTDHNYHNRDMYDYHDNKYTMMIFRWTHVKWYDSYPEIAYWNDLASVWEDAFKNTLCMEVARVGEQADDVEVNYYGEHIEYCLSIHTEVDEGNMPSRTNIGDIKLKGEQDE